MSRWKGFLPKNAIVMARKRTLQATAVEADLASEPAVEPSPEPAKAPIKESRQESARQRLLIFLEQPFAEGEQQLLSRMMAAIQLADRDYVVESGDFPKASSDFVLGVGLSARKQGRLSALRPDAVLVPSLEEIRTDPLKKKAAWEILQQLQARMKVAF